MVPIQTEEMKDGNPLRVCVESYGYLPVDKEAFKGEIPEIKNMVPFAPFDFFIKRKLFLHNMGHAMTAYLGDLLGIEYIYEAIDNDEIYIIDSLSATYPIRIMTDYACSLAARGLAAKEIAEKVNALKPRVKLLAVLDTLEYLSKGGRIPKSVATIGEIARIKPVITLTKTGEVGVLAKCIGKNKAMSRIMQEFSSLKVDPAFPCTTIFSYGTENCEQFEQKLSENGYSITERMQIGAAIGSHIGPRAYGIVFVEQE